MIEIEKPASELALSDCTRSCLSSLFCRVQPCSSTQHHSLKPNQKCLKFHAKPAKPQSSPLISRLPHGDIRMYVHTWEMVYLTHSWSSGSCNAIVIMPYSIELSTLIGGMTMLLTSGLIFFERSG